jgi:hypothetical protein
VSHAKRLDVIEQHTRARRLRNPAMAAKLAKLSTSALMELREIVLRRESGGQLTGAERARLDDLRPTLGKCS